MNEVEEIDSDFLCFAFLALVCPLFFRLCGKSEEPMVKFWSNEYSPEAFLFRFGVSRVPKRVLFSFTLYLVVVVIDLRLLFRASKSLSMTSLALDGLTTNLIAMMWDVANTEI